MNIEDLKEKTSELIGQCQRYISDLDELDATIFYPMENKIQPLTVRIEDPDDKDFLTKLLRSTTAINDSIILIVDTFVADVGDTPLDELPESIEGHTGSSSALLAFVYTKEKTYTKTVLYKKRGPKDYVFLDAGWKEDPVEGLFSNPYLD